MKISPDLDEVRKIAAAGKHGVLPVNCEMPSGFRTPAEALKKLKRASSHCYLVRIGSEKRNMGALCLFRFRPQYGDHLHRRKDVRRRRRAAHGQSIRFPEADIVRIQEPAHQRPAALHMRACRLFHLLLRGRSGAWHKDGGKGYRGVQGSRPYAL